MTTIDLSAMSANVRQDYIRIGRGFGSVATLAQANKHLQALGKFGAELTRHGFSAADAAQLASARDALERAAVDRSGVRGGNRTTLQTHRELLAAARRERRAARTIVLATARALRQGGVEADEAVARKLDAVLMITRRSPGRVGEKLAEQLEVLLSVLRDVAVVTATADRGGPLTVAALDATLVKLRASNQEHTGAGTRVETERLDILDGLVLTLMRNARKAAVDAAARLGSPALAAAFELTEIYGQPRATATTSPAPTSPVKPCADGPRPVSPSGGTPASMTPASMAPASMA
ncbi:hypothetical protein [Chondromyces crocatus]|uniref:Uncharacterized protein n=1 Tax=Chondromyces crocatus TaxID=52 RepID=A0A0K1E7S5_CHOCO|nr:hypothetical protein [Chondromyces crocatus]AKT36732.1 uncharacterized protein CMC5_008530 [Chondromyces crocatus]